MPYGNLIPQSERSEEERKKIASAGGKASGESKRKSRDLRIALEALLERDYTDDKGRTITGTEMVAARLFREATKGNVRAFETLRDTVGQKPIEKVMIAEVDQGVIDEVERMVNEE